MNYGLYRLLFHFFLCAASFLSLFLFHFYCFECALLIVSEYIPGVCVGEMTVFLCYFVWFWCCFSEKWDEKWRLFQCTPALPVQAYHWCWRVVRLFPLFLFSTNIFRSVYDISIYFYRLIHNSFEYNSDGLLFDCRNGAVGSGCI